MPAFFMPFFTYILQSRANDSFYKGSTHDLVRRFSEHNAGQVDATRPFLPWNLVWFTEKKSRAEAFRLEMKLKNLSVARTLSFIKKYPVPFSPESPEVAPVHPTSQ